MGTACLIEYPCIRLHVPSGVVVLFSGPSRGTVIVAAGRLKLAEHRSDWTDMHPACYHNWKTLDVPPLVVFGKQTKGKLE